MIIKDSVDKHGEPKTSEDEHSSEATDLLLSFKTIGHAKSEPIDGRIKKTIDDSSSAAAIQREEEDDEESFEGNRLLKGMFKFNRDNKLFARSIYEILQANNLLKKQRLEVLGSVQEPEEGTLMGILQSM